jgi:hypothetical protein
MKIAIYDLSFLKKSLAGNIKHSFLLQIDDLVVKCFDIPHMAAILRDFENIKHFPNKVTINPLDPITNPTVNFTINDYSEFYPTLQTLHPELFL